MPRGHVDRHLAPLVGNPPGVRNRPPAAAGTSEGYSRVEYVRRQLAVDNPWADVDSPRHAAGMGGSRRETGCACGTGDMEDGACSCAEGACGGTGGCRPISGGVHQAVPADAVRSVSAARRSAGALLEHVGASTSVQPGAETLGESDRGRFPHPMGSRAGGAGAFTPGANPHSAYLGCVTVPSALDTALGVLPPPFGSTQPHIPAGLTAVSYGAEPPRSLYGMAPGDTASATGAASAAFGVRARSDMPMSAGPDMAALIGAQLVISSSTPAAGMPSPGPLLFDVACGAPGDRGSMLTMDDDACATADGAWDTRDQLTAAAMMIASQRMAAVQPGPDPTLERKRMLRRQSHNAVERRRRDTINTLMHQLCGMVVPCSVARDAGTPGEPCPYNSARMCKQHTCTAKNEMLEAAINHVRRLHAACSDMAAVLQDLTNAGHDEDLCSRAEALLQQNADVLRHIQAVSATHFNFPSP